MAELYIFDQEDNFITILSKETGLVDTRFKDYQNHIPDEPFVFNVKQNSPLLKLIADENQVAFYDRDNDLRLMRIKGLREVTTSKGGFVKYNIQATCEPSYLELYDHFIEDRRITDGTAQTALNRALDGSRYIGEVTVDLGLASDNFYWIDGIEAVFKIIGTWGGALKDTVTLDDDNEIIERKLWIVQRLGADNGLIVEPDYNAEQIERKTLSYVETALWGQGASLQIEDDDGDLTGGYTRYLTFEDVEWKVSNGDPVDKPKGQKWVGDPDALARDGYLHNGVRKHRFGHFSNQDYETPEELLWATWQELQERKLKEIIHEATIYESDKEVSLGDTVTILNRKYNKPIELQSQITGLEYDVLEIEEVTITVGKYIDMNEDPLQKEVDDLKESVNRPRPTKPIDNGSFPDIKPGIPTNVTADGAFQTIQLFWDYDSSVYISHYEVYGSQISDFIPDDQHLLYRGRVSAFSHEVETDQTWYYYVRAVNTRGTVGEFSVRTKGSSVRVISDDILFGSILADHLEDNLDLANKLSDGTLDWINEEPLYEIRQSESRILTDVGNRIGDVLNDIDLINDDLGELQYQDVEINNRIDGLSTVVQDTTGALNDLTGEVEHQSTQISKWEQRADGFEQSVTNVEGDLENAWTEMSLIDQKADNISLSVSELETDFEDLEIGGRNLLLNSGDIAITGSDASSYIRRTNSENLIRVEAIADRSSSTNFYNTGFANYWANKSEMFKNIQKGEEYTLSMEIRYSGSSRIRLGFDTRSPQGADYARTQYVTDTEGEWVKVYATKKESGRSLNQQSLLIGWFDRVEVGDFIEIRNIKLEKGNKATDWTPAPEDMADKSQLISYINLSTEGVRIHGEKVHISGQTIIDDGIIGSAAIANLAVDSFHLKQGIIDNVHIVDASIEHTKMKSLNVDQVVAGEMSLNYLKSGTIDTNKFTVRGGSATDYTLIEGSFFESRGQFVRNWRGETSTSDVTISIKNGYVRASSDKNGSLYFSDYGISTYPDAVGGGAPSGTIAFRDTEYSTAGGVTVNSGNGVVALRSDNNRIVIDSHQTVNIESNEASVYLRPMRLNRLGNNEFRFWIKDNDHAGDSDGVLTYGSGATGSEHGAGLRFKKSTVGDSIVDITNGVGDLSSGKARGISFIGDLEAPYDNVHALVNEEFRVRNKGNTSNRDLQARHGRFNSIRVNDSGGNLYLGTSTGEIRVTDNTLAEKMIFRPIRAKEFFSESSGRFFSDNGVTYVQGNSEVRATRYMSGTLVPMIAKEFNTSSLAELKQDIEPWMGSALEEIRQSTIYHYRFKDDVEDGIDHLKYGFAIGHGYYTPPQVLTRDKKGVDIYSHNSLNTRAIQELDNKLVSVEDRLNEKDLEIQYLKQKVKQLEEKVA